MIKQLFLFATLFCSFSNLKSQVIDTTILYAQIDSLVKSAEDYYSQGQYSEMYNQTSKAIDLAFNSLDTLDSKYSECLDMHASALILTGKLEESLEAFKRLSNITKTKKGSVNIFYAKNIHNIGRVYNDMGQYQKAEEFQPKNSENWLQPTPYKSPPMQ